LENDKWDFNKSFFIGRSLTIGTSGYSSIDFSGFKNIHLKNEIKFYVYYNFKNKFLKNSSIGKMRSAFNVIAMFCNKYYFDLKTLNDINNTVMYLKYESFYSKLVN